MSLLSALLTQDQVVSPEKLDEAIQRQVLSGGDFETSLLEVGAIAEDTLAAYCAAACELPVATRDEVIAADPVAIERLPRATAERFGVTALRIDQGRLILAFRNPVDTATRAAVEGVVGMPIEARIATPFRVTWALSRAYGLPLEARYTRLADKLQTRAAGVVPVISVGAARESLAPDPRMTASAKSTRSALAALAKALEDDDEDDEEEDDESTRSTAPSLAEASARAVKTSTSERVLPPPEAAAAVIVPPGTRPAPPPTSRPPPAMPGGKRESVRPSASAATRPHRVPDLFAATPASAAPERSKTGSAAARLSLADARARLAAADTRNAVVAAMLDYLSARLGYVAAFVLHVDDAEGLSARGDGLRDDALRSVALPLEEGSALREARDLGIIISRVIASEGADARVRSALLRPSTSHVVAAPVRIAGRSALLIWGDVGTAVASAAAVRNLGAFLDECGAAFTRVVRARKQGGRASAVPAAPSASIVPQVSVRLPSVLPAASAAQRGHRPSRDQQLQALRQAIVGEAPPNPGPRPSSAPSKAPTARTSNRPPKPAPVTVAPAPARSVPPATPARAIADAATRGAAQAASRLVETERLVAEIVRTNTISPETSSALVGQGERALEVIFKHFPGPNTIDRTQVPLRLPSVAEAGPLLRLVVTFRQSAVPRLLNALDTGAPDARFAALVCLGEVIHPAAIPKLALRLLDADYPTRMATIEVLRGYRRFPEFAEIGKTLRLLLADATAPPDRRRIAAHALGELRDTDAAPALIAALSDADFALAGSAHRALVVLTRQDFGTDTARWLGWWERSRGQHRIEWLIDALLHTEPTIRHDASEELKRLSGQFFGYYFNLPRRERERAHQRYVDWWKREGATRFAERR